MGGGQAGRVLEGPPYMAGSMHHADIPTGLEARFL